MEDEEALDLVAELNGASTQKNTNTATNGTTADFVIWDNAGPSTAQPRLTTLKNGGTSTVLNA